MTHRRLESALRCTRIGGLHTTIPLGIEICRRPEFIEGDFHTESLAEWLDRVHLPTAPPEMLVKLAGIVTRRMLGGLRPRSGPAAPFDAGRWGHAAHLENTGRG